MQCPAPVHPHCIELGCSSLRGSHCAAETWCIPEGNAVCLCMQCCCLTEYIWEGTQHRGAIKASLLQPFGPLITAADSVLDNWQRHPWFICLAGPEGLVYALQVQTSAASQETPQRSCVAGGSVQGPSTPFPEITIPLVLLRRSFLCSLYEHHIVAKQSALLVKSAV